ncbi:MATE family efflux transporter [Haliea sp. AH-315-K21]|uniref:Multidrug-efflux transporter n=1 Tax=SAR86 cluster bacterium TaxID=2030880 RepID=A0A2A5CCQ4_9GAMM|nr:MATE family efflux transporter [Haliea sp. AH-315-K21]PCJ41240.1 MAG: MATE family efflux transporter [SAR86 cluster bacterium]
MMVSQGAFAVMIFTDRYFLAQIGPVHMAAALGGGVAWYFSISLLNGILSYATALVAQYLGSNELHKCSRVITQGIIMALACTPLLILVGFAMRNIFAGMGHAPDQVELEVTYYSILMFCSVTTLIKVCLSTFFSGVGKTKVVMVSDVLGILFNIPLSWCLIFGKLGLPALGIAGAAYGTVISTVFTIAIYLLFYFAKENREQFKIATSFVFDRGIAGRYLRLGFPSGLEMFMNVAAFNLFLLMFQSYGIAEAASATIVFNWDILSFVPLLGLNIAVMSMIGRFVGSGDMRKANEITTAGYILGIGYSLFLALIFLIFRDTLVDVFIFYDEGADEIRSLTRYMMVGLSCYVLCEGMLQVAAGVLRGAGDTRWVMWASTSLHWLMLVIQFLIIKVFAFGPRVSWIAFVIMILGIAGVFIYRLGSNRWRDPDKLKAVMAE